MATYIPLTDWQVGYNTQSGTTFMGAAVRIVADIDASTPTSYKLYAECSAYQKPGSSSTYSCLWYYNGNFEGYHNATWTNSTGPVGTIYRASLGTFTAGQTATSGTWRYRIDFYDYGSRWAPTSGTITQSYTVPSAPSAPTSVTNTRVSDSQNTVAWTLPTTTYTRLRVKRYVDGSTLSGNWTLTGSSYADTGTSAGHSYKYGAALELVPELGEDFLLSSSEVSSGTTYNTPTAPTAISGARSGASTVHLTLANTASTSTGLEVQASTSSSDWSSAISQTYSGAGLASVDFTGLAGVYYFRARNTRDTLASAWSPVSSAVATLTAPYAPTLTAPTGAVHNFTASTQVTFAWQHNPVDGSSQTAATIQISFDGGSSWSSYTVTTAQTYTHTFLSGSSGKTVTWRAKTKGAADDYGPYSATRQFLLAEAPSVSVTLTDGNGNDVTGGTLTDMPLCYQLAVTDATGNTTSAAVSVGGYAESVDTATLSGEISAMEFLPDDDRTYAFTASVQSTTTLTATGSVSFTTAFVMPQAGTLTISDNEGVESISVGLAPAEPDETEAESISLYRSYRGQRALLASGLSAGASVTDIYAPLNADYSYLVVTTSAAGISRTEVFPAHIDTRCWMVLWGENVARARYNPKGSLGFSRPEKTQVRYAGRTWPVSYDGTQLADTRSMTWDILTLEERDAFIALMEAGGRGVYKSGDGDVFMADFEASFSPSYTSRLYGSVTLKVTRIESGVL